MGMENSWDWLKKRSEQAKSRPYVKSDAENQIRESLPPWPESVRAVPNGFLRTALFGAIAKGRRRYINGEDLATIDGVTIRYKGERLDQGDLDVWACVLHAIRLQELGSQCGLTSYALLKLMGKTDTGKNRVTLRNRIERLVANAVSVKQGRYSYIGSLISSAAKDEKTQMWLIELDPRLRPLFESDQFTQLEWAVRHELDGKPLAQWLHGFYSTHAKPYPMKVATLHRLCGSEAVLLSDFKKDLRRALDAIANSSDTHGQKFQSAIRGDLVYVEKQPKAKRQKRSQNMPFHHPRNAVPMALDDRSCTPAMPFSWPSIAVPAPPQSTGQNIGQTAWNLDFSSRRNMS